MITSDDIDKSVYIFTKCFFVSMITTSPKTFYYSFIIISSLCQSSPSEAKFLFLEESVPEKSSVIKPKPLGYASSDKSPP